MARSHWEAHNNIIKRMPQNIDSVSNATHSAHSRHQQQ